MAAPSSRHFIRALAASANDLRQWLTSELASGCDAALAAARDSLAASLGREVPADQAADVLAQSAACAAPILVGAVKEFAPVRSLLGQLADWERWAVSRALGMRDGCDSVPSTEYSVLSTRIEAKFAAHHFEHFLQLYCRDRRKRRGVFFTPQPIAGYIVAEADRMLRSECDLDNGLASPHVWILDPAVGTGVFLLSVIEQLHRAMTTQGREEGQSDTQIADHWNEFVPTLLPRLVGIEILPAAALLAKLNIAAKLAATGYRFDQPAAINIILGDALSPAIQSAIRNPQSAFPIILGNPPFSSLSTNTNEWIAGLVRGDDEIRGYVRANGQRLNERKTWLHDDYVKFIRLAQWHVEQAGRGIVGFVTNHGYLDNATFRLMRSELLRVFPQVQIVDLHGNRKKCEVSPDGGRDENVFGLDQGVAIGLFCRPTLTRSVSEGPTSRVVKYAELWGTQDAKLETLSSSSLTLRVSVLQPQSPDWRFVPALKRDPRPEYKSAWSLADAMPVNATAPVTARDHFVVAFIEDELRRRVAEFRDLSISDDEIRSRYFTRTRSARYQLGDTRGWQLSTARRIVAADEDWERHIVRCLYRPFDWRFVFWHPVMIDWPRTHVTQQLIPPPGISHQPPALLCLIARRQQLPAQPCTFFWIADGLALDGVIRSDNRGSESLFPLFVREESPSAAPRWVANFAPAFLDEVQDRIGRPVEPVALLGYIYALFYSTRYRERYADVLRTAFPRILLPTSADLFDELSQLGQNLIACHLLGDPPQERHGDSQAMPHEVENFRAGGYVAIRKWLQPKHRSRQDPQFRRIAQAIHHTQELAARIERTIVASGSHFLGASAID